LEKIIINTPASRSEILVGERWEKVFEMIPSEGSVIITDDNVKRLYGGTFPDIPVLCVTPGEASKRLEVIENLSDQLLNIGTDRKGFILAVGGGVVCDIAGFLAAIYMRGVRCGYVSTTLLSQVDASTGGKNGVNLGSSKNMIGTIRQPEFVICDTTMLQSLPEDEYLSGLAELIKTAVIGNRDLFRLVEENIPEILSRNPELLIHMVTESVRFKGHVVSEDENENGLRRILNFGHTFGHAIELFKGIKHGFAISSGMVLATEFSAERGLVGTEERLRILRLLENFGLDGEYYISDDEMKNLILHDKKKTGDTIHFVFTRGIGEAFTEKLPVEEVLGFYRRYREKNYKI
jgi:3-dehydroquinate synthase